MRSVQSNRLQALWVLVAWCAVAQAQAPLLQDEAKELREAFISWALPEFQRLPQTAGSAFRLEAGSMATGPNHEHWIPVLGHEGWAQTPARAGLGVNVSQLQGPWSFNASVFAFKEQGGRERISVPTWSLAYQRRWRLALEQSPFQWGYGFSGSYLFGTSHAPFPRLDVQSPGYSPQPFGIPLGDWRFHLFLGQLEEARRVPEWNSERSMALLRAQEQGGLIRRPLLSGYRAIARFGPNVELTISAASMWGGVGPDGRSRTHGYGLGDYVLAFFGAENLKVERSSAVPSQGELNAAGYKAESNALALAEARIRLPALARAIGATGLFLYGGLGAENVRWQWETFLHHPGRSLWGDFKTDLRLLRPRAEPRRPANDFISKDDRESVPNLQWPNGSAGVQALWTSFDLAYEHMDNRTGERPGTGYQTYTHSGYLAGHSREGDPLGYTFGGSVVVDSLQLGLRSLSERWLELTLSRGRRAFRDGLDAWQGLHPGATRSAWEPFLHLQLGFQHALGFWRVGGSVARYILRDAEFVVGSSRREWSIILSAARRL